MYTVFIIPVLFAMFNVGVSYLMTREEELFFFFFFFFFDELLKFSETIDIHPRQDDNLSRTIVGTPFHLHNSVNHTPPSVHHSNSNYYIHSNSLIAA